MKKINSIKLIFLSLILLWAVACRSTNDNIEPNTGTTAVKIIIKGSNFDDSGSLIPKASIEKNGSALGIEQRQEITLKGNDDYRLVATLTPINESNKTFQATNKINPLAVTETNPLGNGIKYKVVVFDSNGNYVKEQDYSSGQADPAITNLNGGSTYTFIVYSIGSTTDLPPITFSNPNIKTLTTSSIENVSGDSDLMYFSKTQSVSGNSTNYLDIILKHKFSQIITTLDAGQTNYTITNINGVTIYPHSGTAKMQLSNGSTTTTSSPDIKSISFPTLNSNSITATPVFINSEPVTDGVFTIKSVTMKTSGYNASITHENVTFNKLKINRGIKYNLKLSFTPNDKYLTFRGYPAVRINGFIWMRHNLGADISADPDIPAQNLVGNYYQWGRNKVVADASTPAGPITGWDSTTLPPNDAWNSGEESTPIKTSNDPCPSGWRVPTSPERGTLLDKNATYFSIGTFNSSESNFSTAGVITSKYNTNVKLTFPIAGVRTNTDGSLQQRGELGGYLTSEFLVGTGKTYPYVFSQTDWWYQADDKIKGRNLRCIAEYPY
ncbi:hypothetical protein [Elizabethkingia anophelis]|uniref:Fibrobacter succinogenes major paralogous domain-containing protein n=1 Tax=Elizabethkingia anophelis TaxID=1117645 RepID=A0AAU8UVX5_9FLAO|nr:hypothetical protein [Elizabethkingia anophelis]AQX01462.1 hypothetical protein BBD32_08300 [Elizabethkingia anophelis]OPB63919.1 hypothetical protein BAY11_16740 [Elizabethkingia anophelis]